MEQNYDEKREARRKRRRRSQILAYLTVIIMILVMAVGIVFGVQEIKKIAGQQEETQQSQQEKVEELLATEESIEVPAPTPTVVELTPEQKLDEIVNAGIEVMPLEDKVAGLFIVTPEAITGVSTAIQAGEGTQEALAKYAVGGLVYFEKNIQSESQIKLMLENTQLYTKYPLFIAVDEEGGEVSRIAKAGLAEKVDGAQTIGATGDANNAYQAGTAIGIYLSGLGFNLDFAPVADLANVEKSVMEKRSYGADAATVSGFVNSMMQGLEEQNVTACLKHFPGIGSSTEDTHKGLASTDRSKEDFQANEFAVFRAGIEAGADMIMVSHMAAPSLAGDNTPSSLSSEVVTNILRNELNFKGVIITDALNMSAISEYYSSEQAAVMALRAGCDMVLMPENFEEAYQGVLKAVQEGTISEERINDSLRRIYRIKYADKIEETEAE
ncbi:MAG: beta-N-acetylhexosaminidase [Lachnospiraceae bacterium]|nr:beta-N-acetylhexosaminidase [Lachnospiraceae bacterium]